MCTKTSIDLKLESLDRVLTIVSFLNRQFFFKTVT